MTSTGKILSLVTTAPTSDDAVKATFLEAIDTAGQTAKAAVILTVGETVDVFSSGPMLADLVVMHRIFSDFVAQQVRENST